MLEHWSPTLDEVLNTFLLDGKARRFTPRTLEHYQTRLGGFFAFCRSHNVDTLAEITSSHIRLYYIHLQEKNLSSHTVHTCARAIRAFLNFCVAEELIDDSPMKRIALPKREKKIPDYLTADEVNRLFDACETVRDLTIIMILIDTGLRATEFCKLNAGSVDQATRAIYVDQGKGRKDRVVFLGNRSQKQLMRYYRQEGKPASDEPHFVSEKTGKRLTRFGLRQLVKRVGRRSGLEVSPHKLRRTFATWAWRSGIDLHALRDLMGHSDLSTLPAYLGIDVDDLRRAHDQHGPIDKL